jgi:hypothetical protein
MEMSLLHAGLAAGAALAALPVILHLFMRQTPKHVIFPALRLIRERQRRSKKRLRVKNWLLLLARMAILALMALALARPTLYSQVPLGDQSVPTALGLVFDTSLSMKYKDKDKTRLDEAKDRAREIVSKLPDSSQVFVIDSSEPGSTGLSPAAALKRIDELTTHAVSRPLNVAMGEVYEKVAECDKPARVVYVLTDLASSAWDTGRPAEGLDKVEKIKSGKRGRMVTFVVRLTPQEIRNVSVDSAETPQGATTRGEPIEIHSRIRYDIRPEPKGPAPITRTVEFFIDGVKKNEKIVRLVPGVEEEVTFPAPSNLKEGELHRGEIALGGAPDPFEDDDRRYFTLRVRPPMKVLVVADRAEDANFVVAALDPDVSSSSPKSFLVERNSTRELQARDRGVLSAYACIFLLNVARLNDEAWGALNAYVHEGGGLVVGAGNRCDPENYAGVIPGQLLPALIERIGPRRETTFGKVADITHPLFQKYGRDLDAQLVQVDVYRHWDLKPQAQPVEGARTLASYADGAPALLERAFKGPRTGRVLLWTTPLARNPDLKAADAWNEFPEYWPFLVLTNMTVPYMSGASDDRLNYDAGEAVTLHLEPTVRYKSFSLIGPGPDGKATDIPAPASRDLLDVPVPQQQPGQWTVKAMAEGDRPIVLGFSVNPPRSESKLTTLLEKSDLDTLFGKDGYHLAEDQKALEKEEGIVRRGYEAFPYLMFLILIVVTLENFLANTFYKETPRAGAAGAAA